MVFSALNNLAYTFCRHKFGLLTGSTCFSVAGKAGSTEALAVKTNCVVMTSTALTSLR